MSQHPVVTERLEVRHVVEGDRSRFVELFCSAAFMIFSGVMSEQDAETRFDQMLVRCAEIPFAKQVVIERSSGAIIGYTGVDRIDLDGCRWLEWGYRLAPEVRGKGYATEASKALLDVARQVYQGDLLAIIHPENRASHRVIAKLGFGYWKRVPVGNELRDLYRLSI